MILSTLASRSSFKLLATNVLANSTRQYNMYGVHTIFHQRPTTRRPIRLHDDKWVTRRGGGWDEKLTKSNAEFLEKLVKETYEQKTESPLINAPWPRGEFTLDSRRCGVLALKIGSFPQWTKDGKKIHCSLLQVLDNHVINYLPPTPTKIPVWTTNKNPNLVDSTKTGVCVVGALSCDPRKFTRAYNSLFTDAGCPPKRKLTRFFVTPNAALQPGTPLYASHFRPGDYVDIQAKTIDYGFQGCMRRYGFAGMPKTHGVTKSHRKRGSVCSGRKRRRIIAGTKMPGYMGNRPRFLRGLKVWRVDHKHNVIYVNGPCIPGPMHAYVRVHDTALPAKLEHITMDSHPPFPTDYPGDRNEQVDEVFDDMLHKLDEPSITF